MTFWRKYIVVVLAMELHIYSMPDATDKEGPQFLQRLVHSDSNGLVDEACFADYQRSNLSCPNSNSISRLFILTRCKDGITAFSLNQTQDTLGKSEFRLFPCSGFENHRLLFRSRTVPMLSLGPACGYFSWSSGDIDEPYLPHQLHLTQLHPPKSSPNFDAHHFLLGRIIDVPTAGLPINHLLSCLDFDDARGVILSGYSDGTICLMHFVDQSEFDPGCFAADLLPIRSPRKSTRISKVCSSQTL